MNNHRIVILILLLLSATQALAQERPENPGRTTTWLLYQMIPGMSWTVRPSDANFAFEWEAAPVLYSFGLTKLVSPWRLFFVEPPARFTGSIECVVGAQLFTSTNTGSHWGGSVMLIGHLPVIEYGEYLALNVGISRRWIGGRGVNCIVGGASVLFGFAEYNLQYAPREELWVHQIAVRMF